MNFMKEDVERIKNKHKKRLETDFYTNHFSFLILILGAALTGLTGAITQASPLGIGLAALGVPILGGLAASFPFWGVLLGGFLVELGLGFIFLGSQGWPAALVGGVSLLLFPSVQLVYAWDKAVVLRLGRFKKVCNPGFYLILPLFDRVADLVDTRIRVTDFTSERVITADTVPLEVDALCFWMVWDPRKALLEVENFMEAVTMGAQTALRDTMGRTPLTEILSRREAVGNEIKALLEQKMNDWGITIFSIEFTDLVLPPSLAESMSRKALAEREAQGRLVLAEAEKKAAEIYTQAAGVYAEQPGALQLRGMNMVLEGLKNPQGSLMVVPTSLMETLDAGSLLGAKSWMETKSKDKGGSS